MRMIQVYSAKGGSGCTTVAVAIALSARGNVALIDASPQGDMFDVLGMYDCDGDWQSVRDGVKVIRYSHSNGRNSYSVNETSDVSNVIAIATASECDTVVIDTGTDEALAMGLHSFMADSLLVMRPCYLATRAAQRYQHNPTGIVLVEEVGRALRERDIEHALGANVVATIAVTPDIARAIDAGLLVTRLPQGLIGTIRGITGTTQVAR